MTAQGPIEGRWREGVHRSRHQRAARLVAQLSDPPPLDAAQLDRIEDHLLAAEYEPRRTARRIAGASVVAAAACLAVALLASRSVAPGAGARVAILGDGAAVLESDGSVHIRRGRVAVRTSVAPLRLEASSLVVTARPSSVVDVDVTRSLVACYVGSAEVQWNDGPLYQLRAVAGSTPSGPVAVDEAAGAEVQGALAQVPEATAGAQAPVLTRVALESDRSRSQKAGEGSRPASGAAVAHRPLAKSSRPLAATPPDSGIAAPDPAAPAPAAGPTPPDAPSAGDPFEDIPRAQPQERQFAAESRLLSQALHQLRSRHDAAAALRILDEYETRFPAGQLRPEATDARINALLESGRRAEALVLLDGRPLSGAGRDRQLRALRGGLRADAGRCREAIEDFSTAVEGKDVIAERALYGRAGCRARIGDGAGARADLTLYVSRFPRGRYAVEARESLAK